MKNLDVKKLAVFVIIILLIVGGFIVVKKMKKNNEITQEEIKVNENLVIDYFTNLTQGYTSVYSGIDVLYNSGKVTIENLEYGALMNLAIKYATDNDISLNVPQGVLNVLNESKEFGDIKSYTAYDGKGLRDTVKLLFGETEEPISMVNKVNFLYDFIYVEQNDIYLMKKNENVTDYSSNDYYMDCSLIEQKKEKDKIKTTIAVAYVYNNNGVYTYYKDKDVKQEVSNTSKEFPKDKIDEFDKYTFTLKKDDDHYIFESVEKVD